MSPDKNDLLLPLPRSGRRSPRSRLFAFLYKDEHPTVGTEGYTDDSISSCDEFGALLENLGEEHPHAPHEKNPIKRENKMTSLFCIIHPNQQGPCLPETFRIHYNILKADVAA